MGDIYHAGDVYAGSVPIDDTQASEDTVYSSAKVESIVAEIEKNIPPKFVTVTFKNSNAYTLTNNTNTLIYVSTSTDLTGYEYVGIAGFEIPSLPNVIVGRIEMNSDKFIRIYNYQGSEQTVNANTCVVKATYMKKD